MSNVLKFLFFICLFASIATFAESDPKCPSVIASLIRPILRAQYSALYAYDPMKCFVNAGELARSVSRYLEKDLDLKYAKLLVIKHKNRTDLESDIGSGNDHSTRSSSLAAQNTRSLQNPQYWRYHVVLDYRFQIADMDLNSGELVLPFHK